MSDETPLRRTLTIANVRGLHARAAAKFVKCAGAFDAAVEVSKDGISTNGTSLMGLLMLAAHIGTKIEVSATGNDATQALEAIAELVDAKFHEETD